MYTLNVHKAKYGATPGCNIVWRGSLDSRSSEDATPSTRACLGLFYVCPAREHSFGSLSAPSREKGAYYSSRLPLLALARIPDVIKKLVGSEPPRVHLRAAHIVLPVQDEKSGFWFVPGGYLCRGLQRGQRGGSRGEGAVGHRAGHVSSFAGGLQVPGPGVVPEHRGGAPARGVSDGHHGQPHDGEPACRVRALPPATAPVWRRQAGLCAAPDGGRGRGRSNSFVVCIALRVCRDTTLTRKVGEPCQVRRAINSISARGNLRNLCICAGN